jgi:hypothetical protein
VRLNAQLFFNGVAVGVIHVVPVPGVIDSGEQYYGVQSALNGGFWNALAVAFEWRHDVSGVRKIAPQKSRRIIPKISGLREGFKVRE